MQDTIEREVEIAAPVDRVWALVTEAEHLGTWFADAGAEIDLRPGGELSLTWAENGTSRGRVERVEPPHTFVFRWASVGEFSEENSTLVEFTLSEHDGGTRVHVLESGFASLPKSPEEQAAHHAGNTEGWKIELGHLADYAGRVAA